MQSLLLDEEVQPSTRSQTRSPQTDCSWASESQTMTTLAPWRSLLAVVLVEAGSHLVDSCSSICLTGANMRSGL